MNVIVRVCLSDFKAKWTTGSVQHRPVVAQIDFSQMHAHADTQTLTHTVHSQSVSQSTHPYSHCLTIHVCRVRSTNCVCVCVFVQSILTTGCHSYEQTVEYTYTFLIYSPPHDSTFHFCFSSFSFLPLRLHLSPYHYIANFTSSVSLSLSLTHTLSHIVQWQWTNMKVHI